MAKNKKQFISSGGNITPITIPKGLLLDKIPAAVYTVKQNMGGFYLALTKQNFLQPEKLYGTANHRARRVITAYNEKDSSTGVLLTGLKGAGKSLLMKEIANIMIEQDVPVVIINDSWQGSEFMTFMEEIGECVVLLDEFGKTYKQNNKDEQNDQHSLLSFFDGVYSSKRLIIMAENDKWDIADLFIERPSRVLFHWEYARLEEEVVKGFCEDTLTKKKFIEPIAGIHRTSKNFTFDSLQALVSQCNMFKKFKFEDIIDGLNIPLQSTESSEISGFTIDDVDESEKVFKFTGTPEKGARVYYKVPKKQRNDKDDNGIRNVYFTQSNFFMKINDVATYKAQVGDQEVIIKIKTKEVEYKYNYAY